jgi:fatty acid desaturase
VPPSPVEPALPEERVSNRRLYIAGCGCLLILLCVAGVAALWYIDANYLWCNFFPFIPTCP